MVLVIPLSCPDLGGLVKAPGKLLDNDGLKSEVFVTSFDLDAASVFEVVVLVGVQDMGEASRALTANSWLRLAVRLNNRSSSLALSAFSWCRLDISEATAKPKNKNKMKFYVRKIGLVQELKNITYI